MLTVELLLENVSDAVIDLDKRLAIRSANGRAALSFRRPLASLWGQRLDEIFPELSSSSVPAQLDLALHSKVSVRLEIFVPSLFSWHSFVAIPNSGGLLLIGKDVSERVRQEREGPALAAVRKVIESMPLCVTITRGRQHRIEQLNSRARALIAGRDPVGELVERALPESRTQGFIDLLDGVFASGQAYRGDEIELRWTPEPGEAERAAYFDLVYQPLFNESGNVDGILHLGADVTEKVERRRMIEQYAAERQAVLEQLEEGVIITDPRGAITFVNSHAEALHGARMLGVGPDEYTSAYSLLTDDGDPHDPSQLPLTLAVRTRTLIKDAIWRIMRPDGSVIRVQGTAKPVFGASGDLLGAVLTMAAI